jgi:ABC-type nitrate/sulfonate/bicarbonate transport system substrate-binding protein
MSTQGAVHASRMLRLAFGSFAMVFASVIHAQQFTDWGWPLPREQVSQKSITWLKDKGWWPLGIGMVWSWTGQSALNVVMSREGLLEKRGLETKLNVFNLGSELNESFIPGRVQVGVTGNLPFMSLVDKRIPVRAIAIITPMLRHSVIVPEDSRIKSFSDFVGSSATVGLATGSSSEFYFQMAAEINGVKIGKDVVLKNMGIADQLLMPSGLDAVVPWDPAVTMLLTQSKGRRVRSVDESYSYTIYEGSYNVRQELVENVPDVVQAITDALVEASLFIRQNPEKATALQLEEGSLKRYDRDLLLQQTKTYNNLYKPTYLYPHADFWGNVSETVGSWLYKNKRLSRDLKAADYAKAYAPEFMAKTFGKLGWRVPSTPVFLPKDWPGDAKKPPYPPYIVSSELKVPQNFPEKGDLVKEWQFNGRVYQP